MRRLFHRSSWVVTHDEKTGEKLAKPKFFSSTYRRPLAKTIKGSKAKRYARRLKVAAMKAAGHLKGDNRHFEYHEQA